MACTKTTCLGEERLPVFSLVLRFTGFVLLIDFALFSIAFVSLKSFFENDSCLGGLFLANSEGLRDFVEVIESGGWGEELIFRGLKPFLTSATRAGGSKGWAAGRGASAAGWAAATGWAAGETHGTEQSTPP